MTDYETTRRFFDLLGFEQTRSKSLTHDHAPFYYHASDATDLANNVTAMGYNNIQFFAKFDPAGQLLQAHLHSHVAPGWSNDAHTLMQEVREALK